MAKRVVPLRFRKIKKEGTDSGFSLDSGTWVNMGEGFGYTRAIFTDPHYPQTSNEEGGEESEVPFETHPQNNTNKNNSPNDSDSAHESMPEEEVPILDKLKIDLGPYCLVCTPVAYRCVCKEQELQTGMTQ